jgi:hypothetical protein
VSSSLPDDVVSSSLTDGECTVYKGKMSEMFIVFTNANKENIEVQDITM